ncbi:protein rapunzel-like [Salvelinus alpinus]
MNKETVVIILQGMEKVSSFTATINPLFDIVTAVVKVTKNLVAKDLTQNLTQDLDTQQLGHIHAKLESISKTNQQILKQIHLNEVNEKYSKYEEYIKHQYTALNTMVEQFKNHPEGSERYMKDFQEVYERDKDTLALDTYYSSVVKENKTFEQRGLLEVYLEHYKQNRDVMEKKCSQLSNVFRMGLMTLMAYTVVTEDDEVEVREKWAPRVKKIQAKMDEVLAQCEGN